MNHTNIEGKLRIYTTKEGTQKLRNELNYEYSKNSGTCAQMNGAVSKVNKKFISHLTRAQCTPSAAATVQVSHAHGQWWYVNPQRKKSHGVKSGERGGQGRRLLSTFAAHSIQRC